MHPFPSDPRRSDKQHTMLFLAGHGLQTPLSAIRWGCKRLSKMTQDTWTPEQRAMVSGIEAQAKVLSGMLNALLLAGKIGDGVYVSCDQDIYLRDFLLTCASLRSACGGKPSRLVCPKDLMLRLDRNILESLMQAVAVVIEAAASSPGTLRVTVTREERHCVIRFLPLLELALFPNMEAAPADDPERLVGGIPGLMLSIISSFAEFLGGDADVLRRGASQYALSIRLPVHGSPDWDAAAAFRSDSLSA